MDLETSQFSRAARILYNLALKVQTHLSTTVNVRLQIRNRFSNCHVCGAAEDSSKVKLSHGGGPAGGLDRWAVTLLNSLGATMDVTIIQRPFHRCLIYKSEGAGIFSAPEHGRVTRQTRLPEHIQNAAIKNTVPYILCVQTATYKAVGRTSFNFIIICMIQVFWQQLIYD